jgi:excisionase family DNA binding protein
MSSYELITGEVLDLSTLKRAEHEFLGSLAADAKKRDADYFDLLRRVKGPKAVPLRGGAITPAIVRSVLYRASHDIADRVGIAQGHLLAPGTDTSAVAGLGDLLSLTEAAELIGITRPATHQALIEGRLRGQRVGNAWVVRRADAKAFKNERSDRGGSSSDAGPRAASGSRTTRR